MTLLSKRDFLKLLLVPFAQAIVSCTNNIVVSPAPPALAFKNNFEGTTVVGEDEVTISWTDHDVFPMDLVFSPDNGLTFQTLATLHTNTPYVWTVPQLNSTEAFLKLVHPKGETKSASFKVTVSYVVLLDDHPTLEINGNYKVFNTVEPYRDFIVRNTGSGFTAISLICTHNGCTAAPNSSDIYCSCHGSRFTNTGQVLDGPASRPLKTFYTKALPLKRKILLYE